MKKMNIYYVVSGATLFLMAFIMIRSLQVRGWFAEQQLNSVAHIGKMLTGDYRVRSVDPEHELQQSVIYTVFQDSNQTDQWVLAIAQQPRYKIQLSPFEDSQVLVVPFRIDSAGSDTRLEGCELLFNENESAGLSGGTVGSFCGLQDELGTYIALELKFNDAQGSLTLDTRDLEQHSLLQTSSFLIERITP